jgi:hypothetical protein
VERRHRPARSGLPTGGGPVTNWEKATRDGVRTTADCAKAASNSPKAAPAGTKRAADSPEGALGGEVS